VECRDLEHGMGGSTGLHTLLDLSRGPHGRFSTQSAEEQSLAWAPSPAAPTPTAIAPRRDGCAPVAIPLPVWRLRRRRCRHRHGHGPSRPRVSRRRESRQRIDAARPRGTKAHSDQRALIYGWWNARSPAEHAVDDCAKAADLAQARAAASKRPMRYRHALPWRVAS
jgi:hypothetical protein